MKNWKESLSKFLATFEHKKDVIGVCACGSYVVGIPTAHSDLDVHIILDEKVNYRERGNCIIDGLLIEYFANPPQQIRKYFLEDYAEMSLMSPNQFVNGLILEDKTGVVQVLKNEAQILINKYFSDKEVKINDLEKYSYWDMLDDLEDAFETNRVDFDFLYYNNLNKLINKHMKLKKQPYNTKSIIGHIKNDTVRKKYSLNQINDAELEDLFVKSITEKSQEQRLLIYKKLTQLLFDRNNGFKIDGFKFKSPLDL